MDLRYRLAVVTGAGPGLGRDIAVALSRRGAAVLAVDGDLAAAEETASLVREARVRAWALQGDVAEEADLQLLAARARDLGGMDLLVSHPGGRGVGDQLVRLTELFVVGLVHRRGRRDGTPALVHIGADIAASADLASLVPRLAEPASAAGARVMAVVPAGATAASSADTTRVVVDLLSHGSAGQVVDLGVGSP
jgi:NAD(P)-dependent dehydrogenase (short-subunit alcohol dehydrogenase family)